MIFLLAYVILLCIIDIVTLLSLETASHHRYLLERAILMSKIAAGSLIKSERKKAGWTQTELAKRAGITSSALSQIESGERFPSTIVLKKLSGALSVSMDFLLGDNNDDLQTAIHNDKIKMLFAGFRELSADDKDTILKQIEWFRARRKK